MPNPHDLTYSCESGGRILAGRMHGPDWLLPMVPTERKIINTNELSDVQPSSGFGLHLDGWSEAWCGGVLVLHFDEFGGLFVGGGGHSDKQDPSLRGVNIRTGNFIRKGEPHASDPTVAPPTGCGPIDAIWQDAGTGVGGVGGPMQPAFHWYYYGLPLTPAQVNTLLGTGGNVNGGLLMAGNTYSASPNVRAWHWMNLDTGIWYRWLHQASRSPAYAGGPHIGAWIDLLRGEIWSIGMNAGQGEALRSDFVTQVQVLAGNFYSPLYNYTQPLRLEQQDLVLLPYVVPVGGASLNQIVRLDMFNCSSGLPVNASATLDVDPISLYSGLGWMWHKRRKRLYGFEGHGTNRLIRLDPPEDGPWFGAAPWTVSEETGTGAPTPMHAQDDGGPDKAGYSPFSKPQLLEDHDVIVYPVGRTNGTLCADGQTRNSAVLAWKLAA